VAKQIKIVLVSVTNREHKASESQLEQFVNDGWVIVGQCACGDNQSYFWVTLQK
jgi:hypothetical protein